MRPDSYDDGIDWVGLQKFFDECKAEERVRRLWERRGWMPPEPYNSDVAPPRPKMEITDSDKAMLIACGMKWEETKGPIALAREQIAALETEKLRRINEKTWQGLMADLANPETYGDE